MTPADVDALVGGYHGDPFAHLGPHPLDDGTWVIRALLPQARRAYAVFDDRVVELTRLHTEGFFEGQVGAEQPGHYRLRVETQRNTIEDFEDSYRFGPLLSSYDLYLHGEGTNHEAWHALGSHLVEVDGVAGTRFTVWAPNAEMVGVAGDFNQWDARRHAMRRRDGGVWEIFVPAIGVGALYKYFVRSAIYGVHALKCDPYAFATEKPPKQASVVWDLNRYEWRDAEWIEYRANKNWLNAPMSVYELHLESWRRDAEGRPLSYRELADELIPYVKELGFTHVELMPPMEHPFSGSWGYQVTGYFAPTARFGTPDDFRYLVDACHNAQIGVIVDWVPAHFPRDAHGLARFDGTALYEHSDPRQGEHKDWGTLIFNFGRNEVRNFLVSSALFWVKEYHIDALRVDAVASMIYLDYSRNSEDWVPNKYGGNENLDAIEFLKIFNVEIHKVPGAMTIAEESTSFAGVSRPVYSGGLGFTMKWNMGWMHDMFRYFKTDPLYRKYNHNDITFSLLYAFNENFVLPISHDEVVHGKASLIGKMPGDDWQRFANVRAFMAYMYGHPGKKLLFMGCELGQYEEWNYEWQLRWDLLGYERHRGLRDYVSALNRMYTSEPALYEVDHNWQGFEWIDFRDLDASVISFVRRAKDPRDFLVFVCNFTPLPRHGYNVGVPELGCYREILNSDWVAFAGSGVCNDGEYWAREGNVQGRNQFITITLPPLGVTVLRPVRGY